MYIGQCIPVKRELESVAFGENHLKCESPMDLLISQ